jgi:peptidoglycan/xylan/chitin deacetylase (PgdA/CDA1 family)
MSGPFILMYHSISDDTDETYSVSVNIFRDQIQWLCDHGFEIIPLARLAESLKSEGGKTLRKKVVITFDDGYSDFVTNALPVLQKHGAAATVFIVTSMLGEKSYWNVQGRHAPLMSADDVHGIKKDGINLGSHTASHKKLTLLDQDEIERQLKESRAALAGLGEDYFSFSYPWGQWSPQVMDAVRSAGYQCAVAVGEQTRLNAENVFVLPRITIRRDTNLNLFRSMMMRTGVEMEIMRRYRIFSDKIKSMKINSGTEASTRNE